MVPRGLVCDFGGVLTSSVRDSYTRFCEVEGIDPKAFRTVIREAYRAGTDDHVLARVELGRISREEFEEAFASLLAGGLGRRIDPAGLTVRMFGGLELVPEMVDAVRAVRSRGVRTALLSNSVGVTDYPGEVVALFDHVVISAVVGIRKPDPRIFELVCARLELPPSDVVFVDDARPNCESAAALGMHAILHDDPEDTIEELGRLFGSSR